MQKQLHAFATVLLLAATAPVAQAQGPVYRLLVAQDQIYRANAWKDTVRYTRSGFVPGTSLALDSLKEISPNGGSSYTAVRFNRRRFNVAGGLTSDTLFSYSATGVRSARAASTYSYNAQGRRSVVTSTFRFSTTFDPYGRDTYTYDAQGRLTRLLYESANGPTAYLNSSQVLYTYNAQGQLIQEESQYWNGTSQFTPADRFTRTYNAAGQLAQETTESVPFGGTMYAPVRRETYTYATTSPARLVRTAIELPATSGGALVLAGQFLRTYDGNGNADVVTSQRYRAATGTYADLYRTVFSYQRVLATAPARTLNAGLTLAPNPAAAGQAMTLHYTLPAAAAVTVDVLDALGRPVLRLPATATQAAGDHTLLLPHLPPAAGLYAVRLTAGAQSQTVKLVVE